MAYKELPIPKWDPRLDKLDRIMLKAGDIEKLFDWAEISDVIGKPIKVGFSAPLEEGLVDIETPNNNPHNFLHFQIDVSKGLFTFKFYYDKLVALTFYWRDGDEEPTMTGFAQSDDWIHPPKEYMEQWFQVFVILMIYMMQYREDVQCMRRENVSRPNPKFKKNKGGTKRTIKIGRYYISPPNPVRSSEPRPFERRTEAWKVNGHWRHYKSGKTVWIAGHVRGNKNVVPEGKTYRI
jgi:hypothetical protein